jgi:sugar-phosphatase
VSTPFPPDGVRADALLLDLDGTLVDTTEAVEAAWRWGADELGVPYTVVEPYIHGIPGWQAIDLAVPGRLSRPEQDALAERLLARMADPDAHVALMPGAADLLDALAGAAGAARWAIVTSGDRQLAGSSLRKAPVPTPPVLVTSDDVTVGKPEPEPYLRAAAALGVVPAVCIAVEDAPAGIASARAAGTRVLALTTTFPADELAAADWVVASLADVAARVTDRGEGGAVIGLEPR